MLVKSGVVTTPDVAELEFASPAGLAAPLTIDHVNHTAKLTLPAGINTASLSLTDGDTFKRFTVTDASVTTASFIGVSVRRANVAEVDDEGWVYMANVVLVANGSFDVNVAAHAENSTPAPGEYPNETLTLVYHVQ